jgi:redox-sensitive bicupin YhaK (pirin superfamily)
MQAGRGIVHAEMPFQVQQRPLLPFKQIKVVVDYAGS